MSASEDTLVMDLHSGEVVIAIRRGWAPEYVGRVKELVRVCFYYGLVLHRVIYGFMAQMRCPQGTGAGGSGRKLKAEFSDTPFVRGTVGAARTQDPNSADSQWFICFDDASWLNGQYTVWGQVVEGMEAVDALRKAP